MWDVRMVFPHTSPKCESYPKVSRGKTQTWTTCVSLRMRWRIDASSGTSHSLWCLGSTCLGQYVWHTWSQAHILVGTHVWVAAHQFKTRKEKVSSSLWKHWANRMMSFASSHLRSFWNPAPSPTGLLVRVEGRRWISFCSVDFRISLFYLTPLSSWTPEGLNGRCTVVLRGRLWSFQEKQQSPSPPQHVNSRKFTGKWWVTQCPVRVTSFQNLTSWVGVQTKNSQLGNIMESVGLPPTWFSPWLRHLMLWGWDSGLCKRRCGRLPHTHETSLQVMSGARRGIWKNKLYQTHSGSSLVSAIPASLGSKEPIWSCTSALI